LDPTPFVSLPPLLVACSDVLDDRHLDARLIILSLSFYFRKSTLFDCSEPWPIDGVLDVLAVIGSGAPDTRWGFLLAQANSTAVVVSARATSIVLVVFIGFIVHLRLFLRKMGNPVSELLDEPMDVDNNDAQQQLPLQDQDPANGLPFPHLEDSNGRYGVQYINM
jgi:hypothetical protein